MRGFEQVPSKARWYLTQFHRPAMLKLVTVAEKGRVGAPCSTQQADHRLLRVFSERRERV